MSTAQDVEREVIELHEFFVDWFNGTCSSDDATFEQRFGAHLTEGFYYVMPGGIQLTRASLQDSLRQAHGSNPDFRIQVRNVSVRFEGRDAVLATYTEHQQGARNSERSDNVRLSTVLFVRDGDRLRWHHIQETWAPTDA
ncbi:MAG: DUF4440 domain-containing protein [Myxococcales bacterium]|nr:DUF4440 domain-containing protein [Myxococcales bacterium]